MPGLRRAAPGRARVGCSFQVGSSMVSHRPEPENPWTLLSMVRLLRRGPRQALGRPAACQLKEVPPSGTVDPRRERRQRRSGAARREGRARCSQRGGAGRPAPLQARSPKPCATGREACSLAGPPRSGRRARTSCRSNRAPRRRGPGRPGRELPPPLPGGRRASPPAWSSPRSGRGGGKDEARNRRQRRAMPQRSRRRALISSHVCHGDEGARTWPRMTV
jgi:hypothetical protein